MPRVDPHSLQEIHRQPWLMIVGIPRDRQDKTGGRVEGVSGWVCSWQGYDCMEMMVVGDGRDGIFA
jgi:hypothetical protein